MLKRTLPTLLLVVAATAAAGGEQIVELQDGGKLVIRQNGTMVHLDAAGHRVKMRDNVVMETRDRAKYVMKNDLAWKQILEKGSLNPKL